jgi:hypothetical protein
MFSAWLRSPRHSIESVKRLAAPLGLIILLFYACFPVSSFWLCLASCCASRVFHDAIVHVFAPVLTQNSFVFVFMISGLEIQDLPRLQTRIIIEWLLLLAFPTF